MDKQEKKIFETIKLQLEKYFSLEKDTIFQKGRKKENVTARKFFFIISYQEIKPKPKQEYLSIKFGDFDRSLISHYIRKHKDEMIYNKVYHYHFVENLNSIKKELTKLKLI